jgi:hypothetical protein
MLQWVSIAFTNHLTTGLSSPSIHWRWHALIIGLSLFFFFVASQGKQSTL